MKKVICVLFSLILSKISLAAESTKCSSENLEKLLNLSAKIMGEFGHSSIMMTKLVSTNEFEKINHKVIKSKILKIKDNEIKKNMPMIEEIGVLVKAHPECDQNYAFRLKPE